MMEYKKTIREQFPKIYSQVLLNNLFKHPYTKIDLVCDELGVSRPTATSYLNQLYIQNLFFILRSVVIVRF